MSEERVNVNDWAAWVLVVTVVVLLCTSVVLWRQVAGLQASVRDERADLAQHVHNQDTRMCALLEAWGVGKVRLRQLNCPGGS